MKGRDVLFSCDRDDWGTPKWLFDSLNRVYEFTLDPCASNDTAKCEKFYTKEQNGLTFGWEEHRVFMNPPYSNVSEWVEKAYVEAQRGAVVVCLLAARTDTKWFHEFCLKGHIEFIKGRLKFEGAKSSAPFPSMIVTFKPPMRRV